jgi:hypothetical protein
MNSVEISGHPKRSCLWYCVASRKFAGSISDGFVGIFHGHNSSGSTMALGSNQTLIEMNTRYISWGVKAAEAYGQPYHHHVLIVLKPGSLHLLFRPVKGMLYLCL